MSIETLLNSMDEDVVNGMGSPLSQERLISIREAANSMPVSELELEGVRTRVSEAVKNLDKEINPMFPDKEDIAETTADGDELAKNINSKKEQAKTILGMKPLAFGLVVITVGVLGYFAYKKLKK